MAFLLTAGAPSQLISQNNQAAHLVEVGTHKMFLNCTGKAPGPTVILEAATGDTSEVCSAVQTEVEKFANVCSYDRLGLGRSDKLAVAHPADEIVADRALHWRNLYSQVCRPLSGRSRRSGVGRLREW